MKFKIGNGHRIGITFKLSFIAKLPGKQYLENRQRDRRRKKDFHTILHKRNNRY